MNQSRMTIPEIRAEMIAIANAMLKIYHWSPKFGVFANRLKFLAEETRRRSDARRTPIRRCKYTPELAIKIRKYADDNPVASYHSIATAFYCSTSVVSRAISGTRSNARAAA